MKTWWWWALGGAAALGGAWWWQQARPPSWARPPGHDKWGEPLYRDGQQVVPAFARRIERVIARMEQEGHDPIVYEAWRSPERAARLAAEGAGVADSLHIYGGAVDIVSESKGWRPSRAFWQSLASAARAEGLTWGGDFGDAPHVQAVPTSTDLQERFRRAAFEDRGALVAVVA